MENETLLLLWDDCRRGSPVAQERLYTHCFPAMMGLCMRYHACIDDAAATYNKAMLRVFTHMHQFRGEGAPGGWIRRCVVTTCINELRTKAAFAYTPLQEGGEGSQTETVDEADFSVKEILQMVQKLPPAQRLVFNLFAIEGYTHHEIGEALSISTGTSKWHLHQARSKLKQELIKSNTYALSHR